MEQATQMISTYPEEARTWIAYAAEVRASAELAGERLTLHDIEARFCEHDMIAIRDRRASTSWWLHTETNTVCDRP